MDRGTSSYAPLAQHRVRRRPQLFKSVRVNVVGWLALIGICLLAGAVFAIAGYAIGVSRFVLGCVGAAGAFIVLLIIDRRRYGAVWVGYSWTDDEAEKAAVVVALRAAGVEAELQSLNGEPPFAVHIHQRDVKHLNAILTQLGLPPMPGRF